MQQFLAQSRAYFEQGSKAGDQQREAKEQPDERPLPESVAGGFSADSDDGGVMTLVVGIDPDMDKNGVALVSDGQITELHGMSFFQLQSFIDAYPDAVYVVEDVEANLPVFNRQLTVRKNLKVAQDVGRVKGVARLIADYLAAKDCRFIKVKPLTGRFKVAKKKADVFNRMTGWTGSSNADKRDAALLALYGIRRGQLVVRPSEVPH
ncbi:hypothetical protein [Endozoicomonas acroporae]|uniref:hypothetical protein n=1 Tax=Endozoicomonas acroporae TaxID=1701104 RepID=UPI0013D48A7D|nr:hypothetical protein [Endozoicomonas acroporae]